MCSWNGTCLYVGDLLYFTREGSEQSPSHFAKAPWSPPQQHQSLGGDIVPKEVKIGLGVCEKKLFIYKAQVYTDYICIDIV